MRQHLLQRYFGDESERRRSKFGSIIEKQERKPSSSNRRNFPFVLSL